MSTLRKACEQGFVFRAGTYGPVLAKPKGCRKSAIEIAPLKAAKLAFGEADTPTVGLHT